MKIKPLGDRVVISLVEREEKTRGGLFIPDTAKEKPMEGKIISVGEGRLLDNGTRVAPVVKAGDVVIFDKYAGREVKMDEEEYLIISEKDILAIVE